ncbi:cytochrome P450 [Ktedonospora formicarum]|uniref:Cytochrome P450 n=1 Tax=Ktedonospora formicarum TaxID=2778364 RepID=A0A8J3MW10_9CHLR|nr:cytochrome P450 [Ktedonospora formicarum]GHO47045.1 cytochrome P450 [Ktedonospora formicarum]
MAETIHPSPTATTPTAKRVPQYRSRNPLSATLAFQKQPLQFLGSLAKEYGDIVQFPLLNMQIVMLNHPDYIKRVLIDNISNYDKDVFIYKMLHTVMGEGLITSSGEKWRKRRRLMQPAFHRQRIEKLVDLINDITRGTIETWEEKTVRNETIYVKEEMLKITLKMVSMALMNIDASDAAQDFGRAFQTSNEVLAAFARMPFPPLSFPTPSHRRLRQAIQQMDVISYTVMRERRERQEDTGDLLSMMLASVDEETGEGLSDQELRDEIQTIFIAGHETSANALSWVWYLLSQHPDVEAKLHEEVDRVLGGRVPTMEDLSKLVYTRMVIDETMRLYPTVWQLMRRTINDDVIDGYYIPAGSIVFWSNYELHRHPAIWEDAERFDPERFAPEQVAKRPRHYFMPFSGGQRICIGNNFALMEMQVMLSLVAQNYRLVSLSDQPVEPKTALALVPSTDLPMKLVKR